MNLSVCVIVKNDRNRLERLLESVENYGWELVVVDTGSTDGSRELARSFTDKVFDFAWCDDFAAAKNEAISHATNEYVLVLDSDEWLEEMSDEDLLRLEKDIQDKPDVVGRIYRINELEKNGEEQENYEWINRLFSREKFEYQGRIHEQVSLKNSKKPLDYEMYRSVIVIRHDGYKGTEEEKKEKSMRNIRLLEVELEDNPDDTYILYQLGKSYYTASEYEKAAEYFDKALAFDLDTRAEYVIDMVETYGYALINSGQEGKALGLEGVYEEFGTSSDFQFLMGLIYMKNAMFDEALEQFDLAMEHAQAKMQGVNSYLAAYNRGVIYECLERYYEAVVAYSEAEGYEPAEKRMAECMKKIKK